ncbi:MAG: hypothetical protein NTX22_18360 [Ignavibacteriales bacterium]|nr:hypothetical protein [Ignavibacteriales bacterium]
MFLLLLLLLITNVNAEVTFPQITDGEIPGAKIIKSEFYDGSSLYGYIDGGADVYLEYGFQKLLVQEIDLEGTHFIINIYEMKNPEAAFGIFSISRFKCENNDSLSKFNCVSLFQILAIKSNFYLQILNEKGTTETQAISYNLIKIILGKIKLDDFTIPSFFKNKLFVSYKKDLKFINGILGLQNGFPDWLEKFDSVKNYSLYILPIELPDGYIQLAEINFQTSNELVSFQEQVGCKLKEPEVQCERIIEGKFYFIKMINQNKLFLLVSNLTLKTLQPFLNVANEFK